MTIIIGAIIGFFVCYKWAEKSIACGVLGCICGIMVGLLVWIFIPASILPTVEKVETKEIYALTDTSEISGNYYLYTGHINEELVYRYVIETDKGKKIESVNSKVVYLKEGDYLPKIEIHTYEFAGSWCNLISAGVLLSKNDYFVFYVPEGSITTEYNIDLN